MDPQLRPATPDDAVACVQLRGRTRENAVSESRLREYGITAGSWANDIAAGTLPGWIAELDGAVIGYCFGQAATGEVVVLVVHPDHEGRGLGKRLLSLVVEDLRSRGLTRLFLGCSSDSGVRSYGFYRHLSWRSTGVTDARGDEVLELDAKTNAARAGRETG